MKAFNTTTAPPLERGELDGTNLDTFVAGDDDDAKQTVIELRRRRMGLRALDAGALENARLLQRLTAFQIELGNMVEDSYDLVVAALPRRAREAPGWRPG